MAIHGTYLASGPRMRLVTWRLKRASHRGKGILKVYTSSANYWSGAICPVLSLHMKNLLPIVLAVFGGVLYHVAQKSVPKQVSPLAAIMVAYAIGVLCCFLAMLFISRERPLLESSVAAVNWPVWLVGISATVIEVSILLAYRAGWNISVTSVIVNISVAIVLLPIGLAIFRERISSANAVGVVLCLFGLYMLSR